MTSRSIKGLVIAAAALAVGIACLYMLFPWAAVALHPEWFGFHQIGPRDYIENGARAAYDDYVRGEQRRAEERIAAVLGHPESVPLVLICSTIACYERYADRTGRSKALTFLGAVQVFSPQGTNSVIVAHEWTHAEIQHRLGFFTYRRIPAWFNEGLAVYVSRDARYLQVDGSKPRCIGGVGKALPSTKAEWSLAAAGDHALYAQAACRIVTWLDTNGGPPALAKFLAQLKSGAPFASAYKTTAD